VVKKENIRARHSARERNPTSGFFLDGGAARRFFNLSREVLFLIARGGAKFTDNYGNLARFKRYSMTDLQEDTLTRTMHFRRQSPPGAPPGTLASAPDSHETSIDLMAFGPAGFVEEKQVGPGSISKYLSEWPVVWVNVSGLKDMETIRKCGEVFSVHPLALEDVLNVHQRVKVEQYDDQLFLIARMVENDPSQALDMDQLSIFLGRGYVLTFQERPGDCLDSIRDRIRRGVGQIRKKSSDYLVYALLDTVVDHYFPILEAYGERLEDIEDEVVNKPGRKTIANLHEIKRELLLLRRAVWPLRETLSGLLRDQAPFFSDDTRLYLRDCYDHSAQIIDLMEIYREVSSSLTDEYLSSLSNKLNEVMKVLTIIATIFMPMSFIAGLYGMNFNTQVSRLNMPELNWAWGYPFALGLMAAVAVVFLIFFKRKGWLSRPDAEPSSKNPLKRG
jgi:magnesium transporter